MDEAASRPTSVSRRCVTVGFSGLIESATLRSVSDAL